MCGLGLHGCTERIASSTECAPTLPDTSYRKDSGKTIAGRKGLEALELPGTHMLALHPSFSLPFPRMAFLMMGFSLYRKCAGC